MYVDSFMSQIHFIQLVHVLLVDEVIYFYEKRQTSFDANARKGIEGTFCILIDQKC